MCGLLLWTLLSLCVNTWGAGECNTCKQRRRLDSMVTPSLSVCTHTDKERERKGERESLVSASPYG